MHLITAYFWVFFLVSRQHCQVFLQFCTIMARACYATSSELHRGPTGQHAGHILHRTFKIFQTSKSVRTLCSFLHRALWRALSTHLSMVLYYCELESDGDNTIPRPPSMKDYKCRPLDAHGTSGQSSTFRTEIFAVTELSVPYSFTSNSIGASYGESAAQANAVLGTLPHE